jgi:hypothetical protein
MKAHPGTLLSIAGVIVLLVGLAVQTNPLILIGLIAAIAGGIIGGSRKATHHECEKGVWPLFLRPRRRAGCSRRGHGGRG